jgi:predicted nucleic acid-binding protein
LSSCLDAWAVFAWLEGDEPAATRVDEVLSAERPFMSWINLGEVFYQIHRRRSPAEAAEVVRRLRPALSLELPSESRVLEAATIKAGHAVAYADAFAVATAIANGATLLTGDPEILTGSADWPVEDLR